MVSHTFLCKKLDQFGHDHNAKIMERVRNESARMLSLWNNDASAGNTDEVLSNQIDGGRKIVFDNFDFNQKVHHMSESHQNIDKHWVPHMCTENRVSGNHLSMKERSKKTILDMHNGKCIPDSTEHVAQRENYASLVSRIVVEKIECLAFLKDHVVRHINHMYSREMAKPAETVSVYIIMHTHVVNNL